MEKLKFDELPAAVALLLEKVIRIESLLENGSRSAEREHNVKHVSEILTINQLSAFLDISKSSIYKKVMNREIPFYKTGRKLYFKKDEILEMTFKNRCKTMDEIHREAETHLANLSKKRSRF